MVYWESMSDSTRTPYQKLGAKLRSLRDYSKESAAEVSSAVEIDEELLQLIEVGRERPSEDILLLLLSHYGIGEDRADEFWRLAGYERQDSDDDDIPLGAGSGPVADAKHAMMIMLDPRVMYSDAFEITATKNGIVLGFGQNTLSSNGQPLTISRVGMSREQAKTVMGLLHKALWDLDNPAAPPADTNPKDTPAA